LSQTAPAIASPICVVLALRRCGLQYFDGFRYDFEADVVAEQDCDLQHVYLT